MEFELTNESEQYVEFILSLDFIDNLDSSLNYPLQFNVYIEFNGNALNVEDVIITIMDIAGTINLEIPLKFSLGAIADYNSFASHPILIFFESINTIKQDTQQSDNNNNGIKEMWVSILDLLPMIYDTETTIDRMSGQYPLKAVKEFNWDLLSNKVASLNATISRSEKSPLHAWSPAPKNVLNITVHGLYNPPLKIAQKNHMKTTCTAILNVAVEIDSNLHNAVFARGTYTDLTRDVNDLRWYSLDNMPATVSATGQRFEDFGGHVANSAKIPELKCVLSIGPRFEWNLSRRFLMDETSSRSLQDFIFKQKYLPVTFVFNENPTVTNNKISSLLKSNYATNNANVDDDVIFVALLDLSMLMQQNCTSVRCLSNVYTLNADTIKKNGFSLANLNISEFMETDNNFKPRHLQQSNNISLVMSSSGPTQITSRWTSPLAVIDVSVVHSFYDQYLKYITASLWDLNIIPRKPLAIMCVSSASKKYQENLKNIIETLIRTSKIMSDRSVVDVTELKVSVAFESMQSTLCNKIQMYITEKYGSPMIGETIQSFVNRIFTDLVNLMKKTVKSFEFPHSSAAENVECTTRTIVYAREADELKQTERAKTFYFDLISTVGPRCNPNYWLLYASFCSRQLDFDTALEYVKEVLLVDSGNRIGLFLYAAIQLTIHEDNNNGEIVLKSLVMSHGDFNEAYTLLSVHYSMLKMYEASYIMLQRANLSIKEDEIENNYFLHQNLLSWEPIGHNNDPLIKCAVLLLKLELVELAIHCLNLVKNQCEQYYYYMAVCQYKKENYSESLEYVNNEKIIGRFKEITGALKCLNNIELNEPLELLENYLLDVLYIEIPRKELHLVYLKAALHYYKNKCYDKALEICQKACTVLRTPIILTLLAKCWIQIGEMKSAECALDEANFMDTKNEEVWAYLTVVNHEMGNIKESKICYKRALECGLKPAMQKEINISFGFKFDTFI